MNFCLKLFNQRIYDENFNRLDTKVNKFEMKIIK